jgi:putative transposase
MDRHVLGPLSSQMTCSAIRLTAGAYASARRNGKPAQRPFAFRRARALFLVGKRGRDADFRADGTRSIWTGAGRKRITYAVPEAFAATLARAKAIDSLTVIARGGRLLGRITRTLDAPEPQGVLPGGVDLNETNALVAVTPDADTLFVSGRAAKVANHRNFKTRKRVPHKQATRKAEHRDTRGVRRVLKRLGRKRSTRARTFAQTAAKQLVAWAPAHAGACSRRCTARTPRRARARARPRAGACRSGSAD